MNDRIVQADFRSARSSTVIVHSDQIKQQCAEHGYPPEKITVIPIGCLSYKLESIEKIKNTYGIDGNPCIGFFGFPFPHKGIVNLIEAINRLKNYFPEIKGYFFSHYSNYLNQHHPYYTAKRPIITTDYLYFSDLKDEVYKMPDAEADTIESSLSSLV